MLRKASRKDPFPVFAGIVTFVTLLFVSSAVAAITVGGIANFSEAVSSREVLFSLKMSVATSTISTVLCIVLALPTAYTLTHAAFPGKRVAEIVMELTLSLPYILLGFALLLVFSSPFGKALKEAGLSVVFEPTGIVFAQLIVNLPFAIRMVKTAFSEIDPRMEFVARTLGATSWEVFQTVILPLSRNSIVSTSVLTWARGIGEFGATLMLVGVTRMKTETLPGSIYLSISTGNNETAMATAMIMLVLSAATLALANALGKPVRASRLESAARRPRAPWKHIGPLAKKAASSTVPKEKES